MYSSTETLRQAERIALMEPVPPADIEPSWSGVVEFTDAELEEAGLSINVQVVVVNGEITKVSAGKCAGGEAEIPRELWDVIGEEKAWVEFVEAKIMDNYLDEVRGYGHC